MRTPMQELLEWARKFIPTPTMIEAKILSMLEKEKEAIEDAYMAGESDATHKMNSSLNYYNETFNTKEK